MDSKVCSGCKELKPCTDFGRDSRHKDGLQSRCKTCYQIYDHNRNKTKHRKEGAKTRRTEKKEHINMLKRAYYYLRKEQGNPMPRTWQKNHKAEKAKYDHTRYIADPQKINEKIRQWKKRNPEKVQASIGRRYARKKGAPGTYTSADIDLIYQSQHGFCVYHNLNPRCLHSIESGYHIDHVLPLARGGSNWPDNLQLLCPRCNLSKRTKTHEEFIEWLSYLHPCRASPLDNHPLSPANQS